MQTYSRPSVSRKFAQVTTNEQIEEKTNLKQSVVIVTAIYFFFSFESARKKHSHFTFDVNLRNYVCLPTVGLICVLHVTIECQRKDGKDAARE